MFSFNGQLLTIFNTFTIFDFLRTFYLLSYMQDYQSIYCNIQLPMKQTPFIAQHLHMELVTAYGRLPTRYYNIPYMIFQVVVLSLSNLYFGYNLVQISCLPKPVIVSAFSSKISNQAILGLLIGLITIGCMFGTVVSSYLVNRISRKKFLLIVNMFAVIVGGVVQIPNIVALGVCRFFQGIIVGCYMQIIPSYISQVTPKQINWMFSHWPQIFAVIGVDLAYILELIFTAGNVDKQPYWRAIFIIPVGFVILQSILVLFFVIDSPYMYLKDDQLDKAKEILSKFYKYKYIEQIVQERLKEMQCYRVVMMNEQQYEDYKHQLSMLNQLRQTKQFTNNKSQNKTQIKQFYYQIQLGENQKNQRTTFNPVQEKGQILFQGSKSQEIQYFDKQRNKYTPLKKLLGFMIAQSLHMTGILAVITQAGEIQHDFDVNVGNITPVTITTVQLVLTLVSIFVIKGMGSYINVILSLASMGCNNIINGIIFIFVDWPPAISITFSILIFNMVVFGSGLGNSVGIAIGELLHPKLQPYASALSLLGASISIIILPIIMDGLQNNTFPAFFLFGGWSILSCLIILYFSKRANLI